MIFPQSSSIEHPSLFCLSSLTLPPQHPMIHQHTGRSFIVKRLWNVFWYSSVLRGQKILNRLPDFIRFNWICLTWWIQSNRSKKQNIYLLLNAGFSALPPFWGHTSEKQQQVCSWRWLWISQRSTFIRSDTHQHHSLHTYNVPEVWSFKGLSPPTAQIIELNIWLVETKLWDMKKPVFH